MTEQGKFDFMAEAVKTASPHFHTEKVNPSELYYAMRQASRWLLIMDLMRKAIFYENREYDRHHMPEAKELAFERSYPEGISPHIIHSILGSAGEAGEKLDLLIRTFDGEPFDEVNFVEEVGDGMWFDAIGLEQIGQSVEGVQLTTIAKIRQRSGEAFDKDSFNTRDLFSERKVLEAGVSKQHVSKDMP